ncbi:hypothetical protein BKA93DRAFT_722582 [Sparassis latifolia]|uniref:C2H2-type domain-containing protein n=1 Tax=Sparassis crispa TaxID=139825 RepID=A0A401G7C2_9APHY|nr:predicted protein [Sparassis crispa]GBE78048.1 predicted protein [Sparassis crispa]
MSDQPFSSFYPSATPLEHYPSPEPTSTPYVDTADYSKQPFDFFSYSQGATDILAPHPDQFESELDLSLAAYDVELNLLPVDTGDFFTFLRSDTPTCGPPSTFTVSSESVSGYDSSYADSLSSHSESFYNFSPHSPTPNYASNYPVAQDLDMDFQRLGIPAPEDTKMYCGIPSSPSRSSPGGVPNIAHYSPQTTFSSPRGSFSDYEPAQPQSRLVSSAASDYYPQVQVSKHLNYPAMSNVAQSTVSPANVSPQPSAVQSVPITRGKEDNEMDDPKRKYPCPSCPRVFARAYNLKTHIQTHDPNRSKPYACYHKSCGRSFSRKHDLTRHLVSIHRNEAVSPANASPTSTKSIGVEKGQRTWCESCGKSWVGKGKEKGCECDDMK